MQHEAQRAGHSSRRDMVAALDDVARAATKQHEELREELRNLRQEHREQEASIRCCLSPPSSSGSPHSMALHGPSLRPRPFRSGIFVSSMLCPCTCVFYKLDF